MAQHRDRRRGDDQDVRHDDVGRAVRSQLIGSVMIGNPLHDGKRDPPELEQVRADLCMRSAENFTLRPLYRASHEYKCWPLSPAYRILLMRFQRSIEHSVVICVQRVLAMPTAG